MIYLAFAFGNNINLEFQPRIALSVMSEMKSDVLPLKWVTMWALCKSEGKPTSLPMRYKVQFFKSRKPWELNTVNYGINSHCTLKYSIKNTIPIPVISLYILVNVEFVLVMQRCWVWALLQYLATGLHSTIFTGLLPSSSLCGPLAFTIQSKKLACRGLIWDTQLGHPPNLFSYFLVPVISISLVSDRCFKSQSGPPNSLF